MREGDDSEIKLYLYIILNQIKLHLKLGNYYFERRQLGKDISEWPKIEHRKNNKLLCVGFETFVEGACWRE